ncbi:MAG: RES family NAD+ phosphorylase [Candidatus Hydrogenedentes bacterium]|nr:RES family NAD+ phosphorylase [Candidatus Hydrogenedentota bacterium]
MRVWRLCRAEFASEPLAGRGGLHTPGRWHFQGVPIVYNSATLSLAALEVLVHADRICTPDDFVAIEIDVPDGLPIERVSLRHLPKDWRVYPPPPVLQRRGQTWLTRGKTAVLQVPSALVPEESNYLINPLHADCRNIKAVTSRPFTMDARLMPGE